MITDIQQFRDEIEVLPLNILGVILYAMRPSHSDKCLDALLAEVNKRNTPKTIKLDYTCDTSSQ